MGEAKGASPEPPHVHGVLPQVHGVFLPVPIIESGGEIQDQGLPDHGRIVIERIGMTVEGTTPTIVFAVAVIGTVGSAMVAAQPGGVVPGLCAMATITVLITIYFRTGDHDYPRPGTGPAGQEVIPRRQPARGRSGRRRSKSRRRR